MGFIFWTIVKMAIAAGISYAIMVLTKQDPEDVTNDPDKFKSPEVRAVSYTHLTLPTILLV